MSEAHKQRKSRKTVEIPDVSEVVKPIDPEKEERRKRREKKRKEKEASVNVVKDDVVKDDVVKDDVVKGDVVKDDVVKDDVVKDDVVKGDVVKDDVVKGDVVKDDVVKGDVVKKVSFEDDIKKVLDKSMVESLFDGLIQELGDEMEILKEQKTKSSIASIKFFKGFQRKLKQLKTASLKLIRNPRKRNPNAIFGFLKPAQISKEMAAFTGAEPSDLKSRVDVTNYIWKYVKDNGLQNPNDKRQFTVDDKLASLLSHDKGTPLMYYNLASKIQPHFPK